MEFLRLLNRTVHGEFAGAITVAEESTAWPMVSRPTELGGLGFTMKWDMGWMHDTLQYFSMDGIFRKYHHDLLTFRGLYAFNENFVLPLSHDEVVHGKGPLYDKVPGNEWEKIAQLRLLYAYMYAVPGKKLLYMGSELAQTREWNHDRSLDWHREHEPLPAGLERCLGDLNRLHVRCPALHRMDFDPHGFEWLDCHDWEQSVLSFLRKSEDTWVLAVFNFTVVPRVGYRLGVPAGGRWVEIFNSDAADYGGSGHGNFGAVDTVPHPSHGHPHSFQLTLPPLGALFFELRTEREERS